MTTRTVVFAALAASLLAACGREPQTPPPLAPEVAPAIPAIPAAPASEPAPAAAENTTPAAPVQPPAPPKKPKPKPKPQHVAKVGEQLPEGFEYVPPGPVTPADGKPQQVAGYAIKRVPVTVGELREWSAASGRFLPHLTDVDPQRVADDLDWAAVEAYVIWRSERDGHYYRLPSELEWARALDTGRIVLAATTTWEWTRDCFDPQDVPCESRVLVSEAADEGWDRAGMNERRLSAAFRLAYDVVSP